MPQKTIIQESFTAGEIDDLLSAREDFDDFYKAVDRAKNVTSQPTGGMTRRSGLEYVDTIPTSSTYWTNNNKNDFQLISFAAREDEKYLVVITHDGSNCVLKIYRDDSLVSTQDGANAGVELPYDAGEIIDIDWTQKLDVLILCHEDYQPREVVRDSTDSFSVNKLTFTNIPQHDFNDGSSPSESNEKQDIEFDNMSSGDIYTISLEGEVSAQLDYSTTSSTNAQRLQSELRRFSNTSPDGIDVSHTGSDVYEVVFDDADGSFNWDNIIGTAITGDGRITVTETQAGSTGAEDAWSATRGWPKHATFYQQRLWFGGSKELPETLWASKVGSFFDFSRADGNSDDAIEATINSDQVSEIRWVYPSRDLVIGTESTEYYIPEEPITPDNIAIKATTRRGSAEHITPVESDGAVYYVQKGGKAIREYIYSFGEDSYKSSNISLLASHLIKDPVDISLRQSNQTDNADLIFMVNTEDGTVAALSLLRGEDVIAFTEHKTVGSYRATRAQDFENYFIVERDIPEKSPLTDSWDSKQALPSAREGMAHVQTSGKLHVIGGKEGSDEVGTHQVYDFEDDSWEDKANLPSKRYDCSGDILNGIIYVGGGEDDGNNDTNEFWSFDTSSNAWVKREDLPVETSDHKIIEENDRLFLIAPTETHEYDPNSETWSKLTAMPNERHDFAATSYDGNIYLFGGNDSGSNTTATVQIYDVANDSWSTGTDMTTARHSAVAETAIQSTGDEIWVIGGQAGNNTILDKNEAYDISGDSWSTNTAMTTARKDSASAIQDLKMYVVGGDNSGSKSENERYGFLQPVHHLEKTNEDHLLDASIRKTSGLGSATVSGFGHLQGETVDVHADGFYKGTKTVNSSGEITLDETAKDYVEAGKDLPEPTIRLIPVTFQLRNGTVSGRKKRIFEAALNLYKTKGLAVNGKQQSFRELGDSLLNASIPAFTGDKFIEGLHGWSDNPQLEITQPKPQPMTLLGVIQKVSY